MIELECQRNNLAQVKGTKSAEHRETDFSQRYTHVKVVDQISQNLWIFTRLRDLVQEVNQNFYKAKLIDLFEVHILEYPINGFYDWHTDLGRGINSTRKISVIVLLSAPEEYTGGELIFNSKMHDLPTTQGSVITFPSYLMHKVNPVKSGKRFSMVTWFHGPFYT